MRTCTRKPPGKTGARGRRPPRFQGGSGAELQTVNPKGRLVLASGVLGPLLVALALSAFRAHLANAAGALVLTAVVVAVATQGRRAGGLAAAVSASLWFDFFLTRPYDRFTILGTADVQTAVAIFVVGLSVTEIAVHSRERFVVASEEGAQLAAIRETSEMVATGRPFAAVVSAVAEELTDILLLSSCRFEAGPAHTALARLERNGEVELGEERYLVGTEGLPLQEYELLVSHRGSVVGRFVMLPRAKAPLSIERRITAIALADQVGAAFDGESLSSH